MNNVASSLDVSIYGREYRVTCSDAEREALLTAVKYVDDRMREIAGKSKNAGTERVAVMAALNIAHELLSLRLPGGFDIADFQRRMSSMEAQLDEALSQQESLF